MTALARQEQPATTIRDADLDDMVAIQAIYAFHVSHGLGSFEEAVPDLAEMTRRWRDISSRQYPYLVAERDGRILGYAYAGAFRPRSAYRHTVEDSIYIAHDAQRLGIGRLLLTELIGRCTALGYRQMVAVIGDSGNTGSINLHLALGFRHAGVLTACGFKFGRWVDTVLMQRALGPGDSTLPSPK
jgi:L-amino acid N-acyltransferase YncA